MKPGAATWGWAPRSVFLFWNAHAKTFKATPTAKRGNRWSAGIIETIEKLLSLLWLGSGPGMPYFQVAQRKVRNQ